MKHSSKKLIALILTAATVFSFAQLPSAYASGTNDTAQADITTGPGKRPIAAYDFTEGKLSDNSDRHLSDVVLDEEVDGRSEYDRVNGNSASAVSGEEGITLTNGFFRLPDNIFTDIPVEQIDGFTVSLTFLKNGSWWQESEWGEVLFAFSSQDVWKGFSGTDELPEDQRTDASFYTSYNGNVGTAKHKYNSANEQKGAWLDGSLGGLLPYGEKHTVTVTYDVATNTAVVYRDDMLVQSSIGTQYKVEAQLTAEQIHSFASNIIGRANGGNSGMWTFGVISGVTIYSTALTGREVGVLANEGWKAVETYTESAPELTGSGNGTFTVASLNVDGLPQKIRVGGSLLGIDIKLNEDGPGADGTDKIGKALADPVRGWDIIGVSENFTYDSNLEAQLNEAYNEINGNKEKVPETVPLGDINSVIKNLPFDTDGLSLFYKNTLKVEQKEAVVWNEHYSPDKTYLTYKLPTENGADGLINKGFRYFVAELADGMTVDVYTLHMDAEDSEGDRNARASQMRQLVEYIKQTNTNNPIIIMGDTNNRYTRDDMKGLVIDELNKEANFEAKDAWVEHVWNGVYPANGGGALMAKDKTGTGLGYEYPYCEIVDKIIFVNNTNSHYYISLNEYKADTTFTNEDGTALADHWPIVAEFAYAKRCEVTYNDGVDGTVFDEVTYKTLATNPTPELEGGVPAREGYVFVKWSPDFSETVTENVTYTAVWAFDENGNGNGIGDPTEAHCKVTFVDIGEAVKSSIC